MILNKIKTVHKAVHFVSALLLWCGGLHAQLDGASFVMSYSAKPIPGYTLVFYPGNRVQFSYPPDSVEGTISFGTSAFFTETDSTVVLSQDDPRAPLTPERPTTILRKVPDGLVDYRDSIIYVRLRPDTTFQKTYILDGKPYYREIKQYAHGLNVPSYNDAVQRYLDRVARHPEDYEVRKFEGFEAMERYGIYQSFGVTVIVRRKKGREGE